MKTNEELVEYLKEKKVLKTARVIEAFRAIDRKQFVSQERMDEAYEDYPLPIGEGQTISQPYTVAFMLELLEPTVGGHILDVGSGSGWTTALLAHVVGKKGKVIGVERIQKLCTFGQENLSKFDFSAQAEIVCGDGTKELKSEGPFDRILASAAAGEDIPDEWRRELAIGGKIVAPVGDSIWVLTKQSENAWEKKEFPGFAFVPLVAEKKEERKNPTDEKNPRFRHIALKGAEIFAAFCAVGLLFVLYEIYTPHANFDRKKEVVIPQGFGSRKIGELLTGEGVIRSKWMFVLYTTLTGDASDLKPGKYAFFSDMALPEIVDSLVAGGEIEVRIVIFEGWTMADIAEKLEEKLIVSSDDFFAVAGYPTIDYRVNTELPRPMDFSKKFPLLAAKPWYVSMEGYLFPDTYLFFRDSTPEEVMEKMLHNLEEKLAPDIREEMAKQNKKIHEVLTAASLIEREVRKEEDRATVSSVIWNRLAINMPLQIDATVNYVTGKNEPSVSKADIKVNSLYNTYLYPGLPLGPISNPGLSAIRAALYPKKTEYLYYLSAPNGKTFFSKTLDEHNAAKQKYLR